MGEKTTNRGWDTRPWGRHPGNRKGLLLGGAELRQQEAHPLSREEALDRKAPPSLETGMRLGHRRNLPALHHAGDRRGFAWWKGDNSNEGRRGRSRSPR